MDLRWFIFVCVRLIRSMEEQLETFSHILEAAFFVVLREVGKIQNWQGQLDLIWCVGVNGTASRNSYIYELLFHSSDVLFIMSCTLTFWLFFLKKWLCECYIAQLVYSTCVYKWSVGWSAFRWIPWIAAIACIGGDLGGGRPTQNSEHLLHSELTWY